jgi:hypothetical protein
MELVEIYRGIYIAREEKNKVRLVEVNRERYGVQNKVYRFSRKGYLVYTGTLLGRSDDDVLFGDVTRHRVEHIYRGAWDADVNYVPEKKYRLLRVPAEEISDLVKV